MISKCCCNLSGATNLSCNKRDHFLVTIKSSLLQFCIILPNATKNTNQFHAKPKLEFSMFGMPDQMLGFTFWHERQNPEFYSFGIWHARPNFVHSIISIPGSFLNFEYLKHKPNIKFQKFDMSEQLWHTYLTHQAKSWILNI